MERKESRALTRRAALAGAVGAGVAATLQPVTGLADTLVGRARVFSRMVGFVSGESPPITAPRPFSLVGVEWSGPAGARIELRARSAGGHWSPWAVASVLGHGPDGAADRARLIGEPIWTGTADSVALRTSGPVMRVRVHFVSAGGEAMAAGVIAPRLAGPVLDTGAGQPPIIARAVWAQGGARPATSASYGDVELAFVHHTQTPNGYSSPQVPAILRSIFAFHRFVRGYHDIAYNFMIDDFGRIWEARAGGIDLPVIGAHAGGYNAVSTGIAVIGSFMNVSPAPAAIAALERLLAWKLSVHGLPTRGHVTVTVPPADAFYTPFAPGAQVPLPRIAGHRDGDSTDCPGNVLYGRLPTIRAQATALATPAAKVTLRAPSAPIPTGAKAFLSGRLATLSGRPIVGAQIELQQISGGAGHTINTVLTGPSGSWTESIALPVSALIRALHRAVPATVSEVVWLAVAPTVTLSVKSTSPLVVTGAVNPPKPSVIVYAYAVAGGHRRLVASKRLSPMGGQFTARLNLRRPGRYLLVAATSADASNAEGRSAPARVTL